MSILSKQNKFIDFTGRTLTTLFVLAVVYFILVNLDIEKYFRQEVLFGVCNDTGFLKRWCYLLIINIYNNPVIFSVILVLIILLIIGLFIKLKNKNHPYK